MDTALLYMNIGEIILLSNALAIIIITKGYVKRMIINNLTYLVGIYLLISMGNQFLLIDKYTSFVIFVQHYLYLAEFYFLYKFFLYSLKNENMKMQDQVEEIDFTLLGYIIIIGTIPVFIYYYFGIVFVYYFGKVMFASGLLVVGVRYAFWEKDIYTRKILGIGMIVFSPFVYFLSFIGEPDLITVYFYAILIVVEMFDMILMVSLSHKIVKNQVDKNMRLYQNIYNNATDSVLILNYETILDYNDRTCKIFDVDSEELKGRSIIDLSRDEQTKGKLAEFYFYEIIHRCRTEDVVGIEWIFKSPQMEELATEISLFEINKRQYALLIRDTRHKYVDEVTNLPKRQYLVNRLAQAVKNPSKKVALIALNLDSFKSINDEFGFKEGDNLLSDVAGRLKTNFLGYTIAKVGGNDFVILIDDIEFINQIYIYIERLRLVFKDKFLLKNKYIEITACVGIYFCEDTSISSNEMINNVNFILNVAKKNGNGSIEFYSQEHKKEFFDRREIARSMKRGISKGEFIPFYQPILESGEDRIVGAEALVRWVKEDGNVIYPNDFIELAEENAMIVDIDYSVLSNACRHCKEMLKYYPDFAVHVNMSVLHFKDEKIVKYIKKCLKNAGLDGKHLVIEITETLFIERLKEVASIISKIRELGVQIALDDFGTGYSSLSYLSTIDADIVKIDRIFVKDIPYDYKSKALVEFIIMLNKTFNFEVVVEGAEEKEQIDYLKWLQVDYIQGYYYYKPMTYETLKNLMSNLYDIW